MTRKVFSQRDKDWIELQATMLVGSASVYASFRKWKLLEAKIIDTLRKAYKRGRRSALTK